MYLLLSLSAAALPASTVTWAPLQQKPVAIECTTSGSPYCRSMGVIGVAVSVATETFAKLDKYVARMDSITLIQRLEPDVLRVVMDYPFPLTDRDYVARFRRTVEDGADVFTWTPVTHAAAPDDGQTVRLSWMDGQWQFKDEGGNTRVTYIWQADPGGGIPDVGAVRKQAGYLAILDMANACNTRIL
jgi:hypothetical protein